MDEKTKLDYDWYLLGNVKVAENFLKEGKEGIPFAIKSLEMILSEAGESTEATRVLTDPEVLQKTIESYSQTYSEHNSSQTVEDFMERYSGDLENYFGEDVEVVRDHLKGFGEEKFSDITKKFLRAGHLMKGVKSGVATDEEKEEAEKILDKYKDVFQTLSLIENSYRNKFEQKVKEEVIKDSVKSIYDSKIEEYKTAA